MSPEPLLPLLKACLWDWGDSFNHLIIFPLEVHLSTASPEFLLLKLNYWVSIRGTFRTFHVPMITFLYQRLGQRRLRLWLPPNPQYAVPIWSFLRWGAYRKCRFFSCAPSRPGKDPANKCLSASPNPWPGYFVGGSEESQRSTLAKGVVRLGERSGDLWQYLDRMQADRQAEWQKGSSSAAFLLLSLRGDCKSSAMSSPNY